MGYRSRLAGVIVLGLIVVAVGAYTGARLPAWGDGALQEARATLDSMERELAETRVRLEQAVEDRDGHRATANALTERLADLEREIGALQASLALSGPLTEQFTRMTEDIALLRTENLALQSDYAAMQAREDALVRIRTPELPGDALLLDRSVRGVTYTGAVCSGSMEPNITCDDLLILYPPQVTDLKVGDIIYFKRRSADCSAVLDGRFMLHRITAVTAGDEGLRYRTRGDALQNPDPCPVPPDDVLYKLLTNVRGGRVDS